MDWLPGGDLRESGLAARFTRLLIPRAFLLGALPIQRQQFLQQLLVPHARVRTTGREGRLVQPAVRQVQSGQTLIPAKR